MYGKTITSFEEFKRSMTSAFLYQFSEAQDGTSIPSYTYAWNSNYGALRINDAGASGKGTIGFDFNKVFPIGTVVEVVAEVWNISGTKVKMAVDYINPFSNLGTVQSNSEAKDGFTTFSTKFTLTKSEAFSVLIGTFSPDTGDFYLRNVRMLVHKSGTIPIEQGDKASVSELSINRHEIVKTHNIPFGNIANEKVDIEFGGVFAGVIEVTVVGSYGSGNATGQMTKIIHFGAVNSTTIYTNEGYYDQVSSFTEGKFSISNVIWDAAKNKFIIKIAHENAQSSNVNIIVKMRPTTIGSSFDTMNSISFSKVYTTDTSTQPVPLDIKKLVRYGNGSPEGVVSAKVGTLYLRQDGAAGSVFYVKETGTGATGWIAK